MRVLVTGSRGFVGRNLVVRLGEIGGHAVERFDRGDDPALLPARVATVDAVIHLAGVNRPSDPVEFTTGNADLTAALCEALAASGRRVPLLYASSVHATLASDYGRSKRAAEQAIERWAAATGAPAVIYRLPNVFGKWCRPNYNSVVATFCHNVARDLPLTINDRAAPLRLVYIDDVVDEFVAALASHSPGVRWGAVSPEYATTVGELADQVMAFRNCRTTLVSERVGTGFVRALYATYVSHLPNEAFAYPVPQHGDARGVFVEMLKTPDAGQFSFFTAHPGVTRGGHYHHTKTEKFLVLKGRARFRFRHLVSEDRYELTTEGAQPMIVETIPGWAHDITNVGDDELVVMLWANEIFDRNRPDTYASPL